VRARGVSMICEVMMYLNKITFFKKR